MATTSGGGLPGPAGRTLPNWADPFNEFGALTILQMTPSDNHELPKNPFIIGKSIETTAGVIEGGKIENQGKSYALYVRSPSQVAKLTKLTNLLDEAKTPVTVRPHPRLNVCRCAISSSEAVEMSETEVLDGLKEQGVIAVRRITRTVNGERKNTPALVLTFGKTTYPERVKIGVTMTKTRVYYPNPLLCYTCFQYGHPKTNCSKPKLCFNCAQPEHGEDCNALPKCLQCGGEHRTSSRQCPIYKRETDVVHTKIDLNIPYPEARKRVEEGSGTFADVAAQPRLDRAKLAELEKTIREKDKNIADLIKACNLKSAQIDRLEQELNKIKDQLTPDKKNKPPKNDQKNNGSKANDKSSSCNPPKSQGANEQRTRPKRTKQEQNTEPNTNDNRSRSPPSKIALNRNNRNTTPTISDTEIDEYVGGYESCEDQRILDSISQLVHKDYL